MCVSASSEDPDEIPHSVAFYKGLYRVRGSRSLRMPEK